MVSRCLQGGLPPEALGESPPCLFQLLGTVEFLGLWLPPPLAASVVPCLLSVCFCPETEQMGASPAPPHTALFLPVLSSSLPFRVTLYDRTWRGGGLGGREWAGLHAVSSCRGWRKTSLYGRPPSPPLGVRLPGLREERAAWPQMRLGSRQHMDALSRLPSEIHCLGNGVTWR